MTRGNTYSLFIRKAANSIASGCILGSLLAIGAHVILRDSLLASRFHSMWGSLWERKYFDGVAAYKVEEAALLLGLAIVAMPSVLRWLIRFSRAWWAGITSVLACVTALVVLGIIVYGRARPWSVGLTGIAVIGAVAAVELWRHLPRPSPEFNFTIEKASLTEPRWDGPARGDPIADWKSDILGRTSVVELLIEQSLRLRNPIVALQGNWGDGKSSVLNLLRAAVEGRAIVVPFNAWLPGSEGTLVADLFRNIATECRGHVSVPQLRKQARAFVRTIDSSVGYLTGLRELIPTQSQWEEVEELRSAFARVPMPILVLLDEIDRMQKEELLVLLKVLRGQTQSRMCHSSARSPRMRFAGSAA